MIEICLGQMPPKELSPNYCRYAHWTHRNKARQIWRDVVYYLAVEARNKSLEKLPYHHARLTWTFIYRINRKRDADNLIAQAKSAQDSLVKAGLIFADDTEHLILMPPVVIVDKTRLSEAIVKIEEV